MKKPIVISLATMKGGTGKTTNCYNLACSIARTSKVLAIDVDPQGNLSSNLNFDIFDEDSNTKTVADIFDNYDVAPEDLIIFSPVEACPTLDLIPSTMFLNGTEMMLVTRTSRECILRNYIRKNIDFFSYYDYILFDTGPNMGIVNQNAFFASDHIILICDPDVNSAKGARIFCKLWEMARQYTDEPDNVDALILNNCERNIMTREVNEYISSQPKFKEIVLNSTIPHSVRYKEAVKQNVPVYLLDVRRKKDLESKQKASDSIDMVLQELIERGIF